MTKENKKLLQQGSKNRAGKLLSGYLRAIAQEMTEVATIATGPDSVEKRIISKGEAMARDMFAKALGRTTIDGQEADCLADPKITLEYRKLILDRIEGKAGDTKNDKPGDRSVPDRISDLNKERLNAAAKEIAETQEQSD